MNIVFSGPSGVGKGLLTEMFLKDDAFKKFTTCTTRKPRDDEKNGFDYFFYDIDTFFRKVNTGEMFNVKEYGGNYYGSLEKDMDFISTDKNIIFQITPDRALEMKKRNSQTCLILLLPPTAECLTSRRKERSIKRIENDIQNLKIAKAFDYVVVNDNIEQAYEDVKRCIAHFRYGGNCELIMGDNRLIVERIIKEMRASIEEKRVKKVFDGLVAEKWDRKSQYVTYYGAKNPIIEEIMVSSENGLKIADIGCGTGKVIQKLDARYFGCDLLGVDISSDMISKARQREYSGRNNISYVNDDFMRCNFNGAYDLIIFSYVLHHINNPVEALRKARALLSENGKILFSVPGTAYLKEIFSTEISLGRFAIDELDDIVDEAGLYPSKVSRDRFFMKFNSYEMFLEYLKSIGSYQKIIGYSNESWPLELSNQIFMNYNSSNFITGEYLTYSCENIRKKLRVK